MGVAADPTMPSCKTLLPHSILLQVGCPFALPSDLECRVLGLMVFDGKGGVLQAEKSNSIIADLNPLPHLPPS